MCQADPMSHVDLLAGPPPTLLPEDPATALLESGATPMEAVRAYPASPAAWAALAIRSRAEGADQVTVYAYSRVGYHRSLDLLRRNGWKGHGEVPWEHLPNRGFLTCLGLLARVAEEIGEIEESERCREFLQQSSATAYDVLLGR